MIITKSPIRVSLFGGSTDYKSFYEKHGSIIIGTAINKYSYSIIRSRPKIVDDEYVVTYSQIERAKTLDEIKNPLIRETLRYYKVFDPVELNFASDIPSRSGLGGSSAACVSLAKAILILQGQPHDERKICLDAIKIEREILQEAGGIQDAIWSCYGGFSVIRINKNGFNIDKLDVSNEFKQEFENSMVLIYTNKQREGKNVAQSHEGANKTTILSLAKTALNAFHMEDIQEIGNLLYQSWLEKRNISPFISSPQIDEVIDDVMDKGSYGAKLLGSGAGGFILAICDQSVKNKLKEKYKDVILDFKIETSGVTHGVV